MTKDPNSVYMLLPLLDFVNHSVKPNCILLPHHDKVNDQSYVYLKAIKDIAKEEQLTISYGQMSNSLSLQKYGFTQRNNPIKSFTT